MMSSDALICPMCGAGKNRVRPERGGRGGYRCRVCGHRWTPRAPSPTEVREIERRRAAHRYVAALLKTTLMPAIPNELMADLQEAGEAVGKDRADVDLDADLVREHERLSTREAGYLVFPICRCCGADYRHLRRTAIEDEARWFSCPICGARFKAGSRLRRVGDRR